MLSPEGAKKLSLAVLSTGECVFPRLGEAVLGTPVHASGAAGGHGTKGRGAWWAPQQPAKSIPQPPLCLLQRFGLSPLQEEKVLVAA